MAGQDPQGLIQGDPCSHREGVEAASCLPPGGGHSRGTWALSSSSPLIWQTFCWLFCKNVPSFGVNVLALNQGGL